MAANKQTKKGGEEARTAWPRLAEYFSRFQLSVDLPCSLEVKAPTLQSTPLYIRPPAEVERRNGGIGRMRRGDSAVGGHDAEEGDDNGGGDMSGDAGAWEGGDGFDEGARSPASPGARDDAPPRMSKAARRRAEAEARRERRAALVRGAAAAYKRRHDLRVESVSHATRPIRRSHDGDRSGPGCGSAALEVSLVVFGPKMSADHNVDDDDYESENCNENDPHRTNDKGTATAKLQVVRMVNGIPLLDSSEALACGVVQKLGNNAAMWNSFGLSVAQRYRCDRNSTVFDVDDSAQVAPFLKSTTHSMFQERSYDQSSDGDDDFDPETMSSRKRKKDRRTTGYLLPARLRLGEILMVVQIQAKPSDLPLPTLSKVSLSNHQLNDVNYLA